MLDNIILLTDGYKASHWKMYPKNTQKIYSYFEARAGAKYKKTVFFGLKYFLKKYLCGKVVTAKKIDAAERVIDAYMGPGIFNREGWEYILREHNGHLPIRIRAVPENYEVDVSNVMMTVENTDDNCAWLTNYIETILTQIWYPCTVATQSRAMKATIQKYLDKSGDDIADWKLHDFGYRGVTCPEQAALGAAAHLLNFKGTDTLAGIELLEEYYGWRNNSKAPFAGSIPATEHSTVTSWGRKFEVEAYRNLLTEFPKGVIACVSDSYNIYEACDKLWGTELRDMVLNRDGVLVVRPDSGKAETVLPRITEILGAKFGIDRNKKGYRVLNPKVRLIQGDGVEADTLQQMLGLYVEQGFSADNLAFGSGGGLLQKVNRDIQRFAFKCAAILRDGEWQDVYKDPVDGSKPSKPGLMGLMKDSQGSHITVRMNPGDNMESTILRTVFLNGKYKEYK